MCIRCWGVAIRSPASSPVHAAGVEDAVAAQMLAHGLEALAAASDRGTAAADSPDGVRVDSPAGPEEMVVASLQREESILSAIPIKDDWCVLDFF